MSTSANANIVKWMFTGLCRIQILRFSDLFCQQDKIIDNRPRTTFFLVGKRKQQRWNKNYLKKKTPTDDLDDGRLLSTSHGLPLKSDPFNRLEIPSVPQLVSHAKYQPVTHFAPRSKGWLPPFTYTVYTRIYGIYVEQASRTKNVRTELPRTSTTHTTNTSNDKDGLNSWKTF